MASGFISVMSMDSPPEWEQIGHTGSGHFEFFKVRRFGALHFVKRPSKAYRHDLVTTESLKKEFYIGYNLNHPSIVRYLRMEDGAIYEEYIDGLTLREMIDNADQRLRSPEFIERVCRQLMDATAYLHSRGVIHNDIKPENVMIARIGDQLKLVDLGCAYTDMWDATQGYTPAYKAPEQESGATNVYTDIFLIGKLMEELAPIAGVSRNWRKFIAKATSANISDRFASDTEAIASIPGRNRKLWPVIATASVLLIGGIYVIMLVMNRPVSDTLLQAGMELSNLEDTSSRLSLDGQAGLVEEHEEFPQINEENLAVLPGDAEQDKADNTDKVDMPDNIDNVAADNNKDQEAFPVADGETLFVAGGVKYYEINSSNNDVVVMPATSQKGYIGNVVIPSKVEHNNVQYNVVGLDKGTFYENNELESLIIGNGPTEIEENMINSYSLKRLTIPGSVKKINKIVTPNLVQLTFSGEGIQEIVTITFGRDLTELKFPNSLRKISWVNADYNGVEPGRNEYKEYHLKKVTLGKNTEEIRNSFRWYNGEFLELSSSCRELVGSFSQSKCLKILKLNGKLKLIESSLIYVDQLERLVVPNSCVNISSSFSSANKLKYLDLGKGIKEISCSFHGLPSVERLVIPSSCKKIEQSFERLINLKELVIENGVEKIEESFQYLPKVKRLVIPGTCKSVNGFETLPNLEEVIFEEGVESIHGFKDCKNLKKVVLPKSLKNIDYSLQKRIEELQE